MKRNSIKEIIAVIKNHPFLPENEIMRQAFNYDRGTSWENNKKYAEMLRRGLEKGYYDRVRAKHPVWPRSEYFYFIPKP